MTPSTYVSNAIIYRPKYNSRIILYIRLNNHYRCDCVKITETGEIRARQILHSAATHKCSDVRLSSKERSVAPNIDVRDDRGICPRLAGQRHTSDITRFQDDTSLLTGSHSMHGAYTDDLKI
jgi:hypothetical protein